MMLATSETPPRDGASLAAAVGVSERTLVRRCARDRWPAPGRILDHGLLLRGLRVAHAEGSLAAGAAAAGCDDEKPGRAAVEFRRRLDEAAGTRIRRPLVDGLVVLAEQVLREFGVNVRPASRRVRPPSQRRAPGAPHRGGVEKLPDDGVERPGRAKL